MRHESLTGETNVFNQMNSDFQINDKPYTSNRSMKFSRITKGRDQKERLSLMDPEQFGERIQQDTNDLVVMNFRRELPQLDKPSYYRRWAELSRICPAVELRRQKNGAMVFHRFNGLVVLDVKGVVGSVAQDEVKHRAMSLPFTAAAFVGASERSVKLLARVAFANGSLPQTETEVETFYRAAHRQLVPLYNALIAPQKVVPETPGPCHAFLMPLDDAPQLNLNPDGPHFTPTDVLAGGPAGEETLTADALSALPLPLHQQRSDDWERYEVHERLYGECARRASELTGVSAHSTMDAGFLTELARQLALAGMPQEDAFEHVWHHQRFKNGADEGAVRAIVEATYDEEVSDGHHLLPTPGAISEPVRRLVRKMEQRYVFRYNTIMGYTEMRRNTAAYSPWVPVTRRVLADLTMEARMADIPLWDNDIRRFVESSRVQDYNIISEYLLDCPKWDGRDHIRDLARTVPTDVASWPDWFHTWFLGMVAQWQRKNVRFGNAIVPLLVSRQGFHKSDFCRQLLPQELRAWGYTDSLSVSGEERPVLLAMTQMLLICLDEFNQISPRKQEGFLKNIIQLPTVKVKRPYARHIEDVPRLASFIATTNQADVLSDPSGSRRFIGIYVKDDIDTRQTPNHRQLFAQALAELHQGARYWFDHEESAVIMQHNLQFQRRSDVMEFFMEYYDLTADEQEGQWVTAAALLAAVKNRAGAALKNPVTVNKFARELRGLSGICYRQSHGSGVYLVKKKESRSKFRSV